MEKSLRQFQHESEIVKSKKEVIKEAQKNNNKVHLKSSFCVIDGLLSSKEFGVGSTIPEVYKGRVVLRGDIVKDDSVASAVLTEQGSSASQMTAAKVMNVIARLHECDGQAADAISACTQVKMEDAKKKRLEVWLRLPRYKWSKSDPVVQLETNLYGHPLTGLLSRTQFEKALMELGREKVQNWAERSRI